MAEERVKRKLTAILCADVVGYSRMMGEDEAATFQALNTCEAEIIEPTVKEHSGRIFKRMGDGFLVEFSSAVDSVDCAISWQRQIEDKNHPLKFRIGINLGDVISKGDDMYGDGINVAARIEKLAEPAGICISRNIFDQIKNKIDLGFEYLGEQQFKNISDLIPVYKLLIDPEEIGKVLGDKSSETEENFLPPPNKPSIAVLPFANMTGDADQEYFSDGITEEIITNLSKVSRLFVIARNSAFTYKDKSLKVQQIGKELGVSYLLEGSVRQAGNRLRIAAQLIDTLAGHHLWTERYDRELEDIFTLQDEIALDIVTALQVKLTDGEQALGWTKGTNNIDAYLKWLKGREAVERFTKEDNIVARQIAEEIIALDPDYPRGYRLLGTTHLCDVSLGWSKSPQKSLGMAADLYHKVMQMDSYDTDCLAFLAYTYLLKGQHEYAIEEGRRAVDLCPNSADAHHILGISCYYTGHNEEAISSLSKAIRLNPFPPGRYFLFLGYAYRDVGMYREAIKELMKVLLESPDDLRANVGLAATYALSGQHEKAQTIVGEIRRINPKFTLDNFAKTLHYKEEKDRKLVIDALHLAGLD